MTFDARDQIFQLTSPTTTQHPSPQCLCCDKDLGSKKPHYCHFCGNRACPQCMHKERMFPGDDSETPALGLICRICDRKYILYLRYQSFAREIGIKDQLILQN